MTKSEPTTRDLRQADKCNCCGGWLPAENTVCWEESEGTCQGAVLADGMCSGFDPDYIDDQAAKDEVEEAYEAATGAWATADWTHENGAGYCEGNNPEGCPTCAAAKKDAEAAEEAALAALRLVRSGNWERAEVLAEDAYRAELAYGDAPVWGGFYRAIQKAQGY